MREILIRYAPLLIGAFAVLVLTSISMVYLLWRRMNRSKDEEDGEQKEQEKRKNKITDVRSIVAPDGINPNPMSYSIIHDAGHDVYVRNFTIDALPKRTVFASTFPSLFNMDRVTSNIFIEPISEGKAASMLDNRIVDIETNIISAEKNADRNQIRKLSGKLKESESWATKIETGENSLYNIYFLFTIMADSLEKLNRNTDSFRNLAKEKRITISCCYGLQAESYLTGMPLMYRYSAKTGPIRSCGLKKHILDKLSVSSIFNHTQDNLVHRKGIIIGRNMSSGMPVAFDAYDIRHNGYNIVFSGMTGTGKSACMKILASRYITKNNYRFVSIDSQAKGNRGEYSMLADIMGSPNYTIKNNSGNVMNIFDLDVEEEWSELTGAYMVLRLQDKITNAKADMLTLIQGTKSSPEFTLMTYIERIVMDIVTELYADLKIVDGDIDSLYEISRGVYDGTISSGKVKKKMPTITEFYKKVLQKNKNNTIPEHVVAYRIILDSLRDRVKELHYCSDCIKFFSADEIPSEQVCSCGGQVISIKGAKAYYDGQSNIRIREKDRFTNIDISQLPDEERPVARQISLSFVNEKFIKTNAINPEKTESMAVICDEVHQNFNSKSAVENLDYVSRTSRKRLVSLWTATQALKDYERTPETEAMLKQAAAKFVFKQAYQDKEWIQKALNLTRGQTERVLELGGDPNDDDESRKGEVCIVDNGKVCFCKIDYLKAAEAVFVETDPRIIQQMYA